MSEDPYLIWSHEHQAWWGPDGCGYQKKIEKAGRYGREQAIRICAGAMPGTMQRLGALPELPVRESDLNEVIAAYRRAYADETPL